MRRPWASWGLRRRLLLITAFAMGASVVFGGLSMYWSASIEDDELLDARLEHLGSTVLAFVESGLPVDRMELAPEGGHLRTGPTSAVRYRFQVWTSEGRLLVRSHEASSTVPMMDLARSGFGTREIDGEEYRTYAVTSRSGRLIAQVAENAEARVDQLVGLTAYYVAFLAVPFGLLFAGTWLLLHRSLTAIDAIAAQLSNRNPLDVTRLQVAHPPEEMMPILKSLDAMFVRIGGALSRERRFTSVAAHELRTPLAALRASAQLAVMADTDAEVRSALQSVMLGVDRATHLINQLLDLARLEGFLHNQRLRLEVVDVERVYLEALVELATLASSKELSLSARYEVASIVGSRAGILLILRNLLSNAMLYCPPKGSIEVSTASESAHFVSLTVDDSGPGIPARDRERAFDRFDRLGQPGTDGVGLGLSIVLMAVELHDAMIRLDDSPLGGLRAKVTFMRDLSTFADSKPV